MGSRFSVDGADDDHHHLRSLVAEQHRELTAAQTLESDLDLAYRLQLEEALAASLSLLPSSSSSSSAPPPRALALAPPVDVASPSFASLQSDELSKFQRQLKDRELSETEARLVREDLHRRIHDQKVATEIMTIPDDDWDDWGDEFERPFGEGSSKDRRGGGGGSDGDVFRLYCKGLVSDERVEGQKCNTVLAGVGVAVCDFRGNLIFEVRKPLVGPGTSKSKVVVETKALVEGLNAALGLELKRIVFYCDYFPLFQFITRRWTPKQRKVAVLVEQVILLRRKFDQCNFLLIARNEFKFAFKLARDAITSQIVRHADGVASKNPKETCVICLEDTDVSQIFAVDGCLHRYCFSCMRQHVEVKLLHGTVPRCPHEGCKTDLSVSSCSKFLTPKLIEMMTQRLKEASIPVTEKIYCPYPTCSALMSKTEASECSTTSVLGVARSGARKCIKCHRLFCVNCKVPWHSSLTCVAYKKLHPDPPAEDIKLKSLASRNLWRQCIKCNHMIELSEGCYHMTCRCGYEFCYNCGAEWKDKKPTCSCPLWEEDNILYDDDRDFDDDDDDEDEEDEEWYTDSEEDYLF
ncbi:E3 ubiquitin-protein ligase RSL1-like [Syzygium oleosum]|uniref:E3 ubiquitin-protein ligase RSL1-like n=1 Tax=Syzygium oleosum TaxID=219896 RepID=UPI0011D1A906|nr:E3 ubiquitin-protein ligase RSL1-like [Syzygium oleosum]